MSRRRYSSYKEPDEKTILKNYSKRIWGWGAKPEQYPIKFDNTTEVFGRLEGSDRRVYLGTPTSTFDLVGNDSVNMIGQWSFSGVNHYFVRTFWKTRTVFNWKKPLWFEFTLSAKNGLHVWSDDGSINHIINDEESLTLIRSFIGNTVVAVIGWGKVEYIKSRKLKEK